MDIVFWLIFLIPAGLVALIMYKVIKNRGEP